MKHTDMNPDHPGIYLPPPFIYLIVFVVGWILQKWVPLHPGILRSFPICGLGVIFMILAIRLISQALKVFHASGDTVDTTRSFCYVQTVCICSTRRNKMYYG